MENQFLYIESTMIPLVKMVDDDTLRQETINPITGKPYPGYILEGVFACLDSTVNKNNRVYDKENYLYFVSLLRQTIHSKKGLYGELEHPDSYAINFNNVSHKILDIWFDEKTNCVMGRVLLLDTEKGRICKNIIDSGGQLAISGRAAGVEKQSNDGSKKCQLTLLVTYDIVYHPGFGERANLNFVKLNESIEFFKNNSENQNIHSFIIYNDKIKQLNESYNLYENECFSKNEKPSYISWMEKNIKMFEGDMTYSQQEKLQNSQSSNQKQVEDALNDAARQLDEEENVENLKSNYFDKINQNLQERKKLYKMRGTALYDGSAGFLKRDDDWNKNSEDSSGKHGYFPSEQVFTPNNGDVSATFNNAPAGNNDIA